MHFVNSREPSFLLMYSPQRFDPKFGAVKPEGSLGLAYLAGALRRAHFHVEILDCSVGNDKFSLEQTFFRQTKLPNGMIRIGLFLEEIVSYARDYDVIGISNIFTAQTSMVEEVVKALREAYPHKVILLGGVNARSQIKRFLMAGASIICLSESELPIVRIAETLQSGSSDFTSIDGIAWLEDDQVRQNCTTYVEQDLDNLPFPAWDLLPLQRYWQIARPHGGGFWSKTADRYAPMMTSRGCPFKCEYCHVGKELVGSSTGNLRKLRKKSLNRVVQEIEVLKSLGVEHVFIEDDSLLGDKPRARQIFEEVIKQKVKLSDVNGINLKHLCTKGDVLGVDEEILELMKEAGFGKLSFPVESGSPRIIQKYATNKVDVINHDIGGLIRKSRSLNIEVVGMYLFGWPDETFKEALQTIMLSESHVNEGLNYANYHIVTPFPGTNFYDYVVRNDLFLEDRDIADLDWTRPSIKTQHLTPEDLMYIIEDVWRSVNKHNRDRINKLESMKPTGHVQDLVERGEYSRV